MGIEPGTLITCAEEKKKNCPSNKLLRLVCVFSMHFLYGTFLSYLLFHFTRNFRSEIFIMISRIYNLAILIDYFIDEKEGKILRGIYMAFHTKAVQALLNWGG